VTTTQPDATGVTDPIDMSDEQLIQDPYGRYSVIRERARLVRGVMPPVDPVWIATRHADVARLLTDPRFVVDQANVPGMRLRNRSETVLRVGETPPEYMRYRVGRMGQCDGAEHARLRALEAPAFAADRVAALRPRVEEVAERLLDGLARARGGGRTGAGAHGGVVDLLADFAVPLGTSAMCDLIGIPAADQERWGRWCTEVKLPGLPLDDKAVAWRALVGYARELIARRQAEPAGDLVSVMAGEVGETEVIAMMLMDHNPHRSIAHLICNGTLALLAHPAQAAMLRENPDLMPRAVLELLRFCGPTTVGRMRHATVDVEFGGGVVRKGDSVWPVLAGANRDPRRYTDPDRLDLTRFTRRPAPASDTAPDAAPHPASNPASNPVSTSALYAASDPDSASDPVRAVGAFGAGPHHCLGPAPARMVAEVAFAALARRFPRLALAVDPGDLEREPKPRQWGLTALPVRL
jgi:cytochrome P450